MRAENCKHWQIVLSYPRSTCKVMVFGCCTPCLKVLLLWLSAYRPVSWVDKITQETVPMDPQCMLIRLKILYFVQSYIVIHIVSAVSR